MGNLQNLTPLLDKFIQRGPSGAAVQVFLGEDCVYEYFAGLANEESNTPVRPDTLFRLASMTKIICCAAAMMLFEKGEFLLTDPIADFIPSFANHKVYKPDGRGTFRAVPASKPITVGDLFSMQSGVTRGGGLPGMNNSDNPTTRDMSEVAARLIQENRYTLSEFAKEIGSVPMAFEPGAHFYYGQSLDVIAAMIEAISGKTFGTFLKENIFDPLGMVDTHFVVPEEKENRRAIAYALDAEGKRVAPSAPMMTTPPTFESASGGLTSTMEDYSRFARALTLGSYNGVRLLGDSTIRLMAMNRLGPDSLKDFDNAYLSGYGYGLGVRTRMNPAAGSNSTVGEFGWTGAVGTWVLMDPEKRLTILYMHQLRPNLEGYIHPRVRNVVYSALF